MKYVPKLVLKFQIFNLKFKVYMKLKLRKLTS